MLSEEIHEKKGGEVTTIINIIFAYLVNVLCFLLL